MNRNMKETVSRFKGKNPKYDLMSDEIQMLIDDIQKGEVFESISIAFDYGYILGQRALKMENRAKK